MTFELRENGNSENEKYIPVYFLGSEGEKEGGDGRETFS